MPERKIAYESLAHKSDTGFFVKAPSLQRLFIDSALAMTDQMVKLDQITEIERRVVKLSADNREQLMVNWLNEVLFLFERQKFLSKRIVFNQFDGKTIEAALHGQIYSPLKHGHIPEVKALTYHQLQLGNLQDASDPENLFYARIFLDL